MHCRSSCNCFKIFRSSWNSIQGILHSTMIRIVSIARMYEWLIKKTPCFFRYKVIGRYNAYQADKNWLARLSVIGRVWGTQSCLHSWHFVITWLVARLSDGPSGVRQTKSAKNYRHDRVPRTLVIGIYTSIISKSNTNLCCWARQILANRCASRMKSQRNDIF